MNILLIHDRARVAEEIKALIEHRCSATYRVELAEDAVTARSLLQHNLFDLAIVDLTIPFLKGMAPDYTVVEQLLRELFEADTLYTPGDIIGLTQDAGALEVISNSIGEHLMAIVEESPDRDWQSALSDRIAYVSKSFRARQTSQNRHHDLDALIVTALDKELEPYHDVFELRGSHLVESGYDFVFQDRTGRVRRGLAVSIGRAGQPSAASVTQGLVTQFRPKLALMSGFCGGFESKVSIGDVLIAEAIFDWDYGKWKGKGSRARFHPRPEPVVIRNSPAHRMSRDLVLNSISRRAEVLVAAMGDSDGEIQDVVLRLCPVASGSAVVAHAAIISRMAEMNENLAGVDMEGFGFYYACAHTPVVTPAFLWVKAVADFSDASKGDTYHKAASTLSARVVEDVLLHRWDFS